MGSPLRVLSAVVATVVFGVVAPGCSSGDGAASSTPPPNPVPGTVTLDVSGVTGATGLVMLAVVRDSMHPQAFAAACDIVDTDPFGFTGQLMPITGGDPCTLGTEPVQFDPGTYEVVVAVLEGGSQTPQQCTQTDVTVDGDTTVEVTGLEDPSACNL